MNKLATRCNSVECSDLCVWGRDRIECDIERLRSDLFDDMRQLREVQGRAIQDMCRSKSFEKRFVTGRRGCDDGREAGEFGQLYD